MKKLLLTTMALLALLPSALRAQEVEQQLTVPFLVIELDSTTVSIALDQQPVITAAAGQFRVVSQQDEISAALSEVKDYHFEARTVTTGIREVSVDTPNSAEPTLAFRNAEVSGLRAGSRVEVFAANGTRVASATATADGKAQLSLRNLPQGVYILKAGNKSLKIVNR